MPNSWTHRRRKPLDGPDIKRLVENSLSPSNEGLCDGSLRIVGFSFSSPHPLPTHTHTPLWRVCRHSARHFRSRILNLLYRLHSKAWPGLLSSLFNDSSLLKIHHFQTGPGTRQILCRFFSFNRVKLYKAVKPLNSLGRRTDCGPETRTSRTGQLGRGDGGRC